jgi:hypothetical protein
MSDLDVTVSFEENVGMKIVSPYSSEIIIAVKTPKQLMRIMRTVKAVFSL